VLPEIDRVIARAFAGAPVGSRDPA
jgi:hypothetical protein